MNMFKRIGFFVVAGLIGIAILQIGAMLAVPGITGFVATAEARVGRPLTPVSVAGVARRTVRRCAVGIYYC